MLHNVGIKCDTDSSKTHKACMLHLRNNLCELHLEQFSILFDADSLNQNVNLLFTCPIGAAKSTLKPMLIAIRIKM